MVREESADWLKREVPKDFITTEGMNGSTDDSSVCFSVSKLITHLDVEFRRGKTVWMRRRAVANLNVLGLKLLVATHIYPKDCDHLPALPSPIRLGHQTTKFTSSCGPNAAIKCHLALYNLGPIRTEEEILRTSINPILLRATRE
jgi:hypothetical protein